MVNPTVGELIAILQKFDPSTIVTVTSEYGGTQTTTVSFVAQVSTDYVDQVGVEHTGLNVVIK